MTEVKKTAFVYDERVLNYKFHDDHPFHPIRLQLTIDLLKAIHSLNSDQIVSFQPANDETLSLIHEKEYIEAVKRAGAGQLEPEQALNYGLGTEDTPVFPQMHEAASAIVGGTLKAAELVMSGKVNHAFHIGGGLHHGFPNRASGFCIYNDTAIAIRAIRRRYGAKVLYIDTDAHHGDGVQAAFYDDPGVVTFSIHETGRYLFPGTGNVYERGEGMGFGYCYNLPLDAFTEDDSFLSCYETAVQAIARRFQPDVIVSQNGVDAHFYDPLTHLSVTMKTYARIPKVAHNLAHDYCDGRWIAVGGGGYDIWRVVPRAWSLVWREMNGQGIPRESLPLAWRQKWQEKAPVAMPCDWFDDETAYEAIPRRREITEKNERTLKTLMQFIETLL